MNASHAVPVHEQEAQLATLSSLEREVLAEYETLLNNLTQVTPVRSADSGYNPLTRRTAISSAAD